MERSSEEGGRKETPKGVKYLQGHFGKVYAIDWFPDSTHIISAAQDGKVLTWNAFTERAVDVVELQTSWVLTCTASNQGTMFASGGMDNLCSIYKRNIGTEMDVNRAPECHLAAHEGYLSCACFVGNGDREVITASGDSTCILWDLEKRVEKRMFADHTGDVTSIAMVLNDDNVFVSSSVDATAKVWDVRQKSALVHTYSGHEGDINAVAFFPNGRAFGTAGEDSTMRLWDLRSARSHLQVYTAAEQKALTCVSFSTSGQLAFCGGGEVISCFDVLEKDVVELREHKDTVSCLKTSPDGRAFSSGSWDMKLGVWT